MKLRFNAKSNTNAAYCIIVFGVCLLMTAFIFKYESFFHYFRKILSVLSPIIWGIAIAYLLNPLMMFCERFLKKAICRKKPHKALVRTLSITITMLITLAVISILIVSAVPEILDSIKEIIKNLPTYFNNVQDYIENRANKFLDANPDLKNMINAEFENIQDTVLKAVSQFQPKLDSILAKDGLLANVTDGAMNFLIGLKNCLLGIVVSIYLLFSKETFIAQAKKVAHALLPAKRCDKVLKISADANYTFIHFLSGKALDSLIIGILAFIGMTLLKMPDYVVLISFIIGITNMIPFFGPFIGAVPSAFLVLLSTPNKTIAFIIFILLLQQFDGNILGPKILGNSLGLSAFWIMFAIFVGGGLFGFAGMILFVPAFAVIYTLFRELIIEKLEKKKLPVSTAYYKTEEEAVYVKNKTESRSEEIASSDNQEKDKK